MNSEVKSILDKLGVTNALMYYEGSENTFVIYSPSGENVGVAGDDLPVEYVTRWDIDLYSDGDYVALAHQIRDAFVAAGWCYNGAGVDTYDEATKLYHRLLEFEREVVHG